MTSSISTKSVSRFNQPWSYINNGQKKENVTVQEIETHLKDKNADFVGKRTPAETFIFAGGIIGSVLWLFGLSKDNSSLKWGGGILALVGLAISTGLSTIFGWTAASSDSTSDTNKPEKETPKKPTVRAEQDEKYKEIKELFSEDVRFAQKIGNADLLKSMIDKHGKEKVTSLLGSLAIDDSIGSGDRTRSIKYLASIGSQEAIKLILGVFKKEGNNPFVLTEARDALIELKSSDSVNPLLQYLSLEENKSYARSVASETLAGILSQVNIPVANQTFINNFTTCKAPAVREDIARGLGSLSDSGAIKPLTDCATNKDEYYEIRISAISSLGKILSGVDNPDVKVLLDIVNDKTVYDAQYQSTRSIARTYEETIHGLKLKESGEDELKVAAASALVHAAPKDNDDISKIIIEYFKRCQNSECRSRLTSLLCDLKDKHAIEFLINIVGDNNEYNEIRAQAISSIGKMQGIPKQKFAEALESIKDTQKFKGNIGTRNAFNIFDCSDDDFKKLAKKTLEELRTS